MVEKLISYGVLEIILTRVYLGCSGSPLCITDTSPDYLKFKNSSYLCTNDSVANDYRFVDSRG